MSGTEVVLAQSERDRLAELETTIGYGLHAFLRVGEALLEIREARLYRETHSAFEDYCRERWGITDGRANQLIAAKRVHEVIAGTDTTTVVPPANEAQARELAPLLDQPEELRDTWQRAIEATDGKPTAAAIRAARQPTDSGTGDTDPRATTPGPAPRAPVPEGEAAPEHAPSPVPGDPPAGEGVADHAALDASLDAAMEGTASRFRRNFSSAIAKADDVWQFDVDRIAEVYAADYDRAIRPFLEEMTAWCERVAQAAKRQRSGLRIVGGRHE